MLKHLLAAIVAAFLLSASPAPHVTYCGASVIRDYTLGVSYWAVIVRDPACRPQDVTRVRKVSTMNLGSRYAPILPLTGAWNVTRTSDSVPYSSHWTLYSWSWQWWDGAGWRYLEVI